MHKETRNKKNINYVKNLEKRDGITKKDHFYINNIKVAENQPLDTDIEELTLTKRHNKIVSREKPIFKWTKIAKDTLTILRKQEIKNYTKEPHINLIDKEQALQNWKTRQEHKKKLFEEREYSELHKNLVNKLYGSESRSDRYLRQAATQEAHERKIRNLKDRLEQQKVLKKRQILEQMPFKIVIQHHDDKLDKTFYSRNSATELSEIMSKMNKKLSAQETDYKCISLFGKNNDLPQMLYRKSA